MELRIKDVLWSEKQLVIRAAKGGKDRRVPVPASNMGQEYIGDAELPIPEAKSYQLKAKRDGDTFALSLVDLEAAKIVATSTAPVNRRMKFVVFVFLP